jgi:protein TonB
MALELLDKRSRAIGIAATLGINALLLMLLLSMSRGILLSGPLRAPGLTTFDITQPPPPAPPAPAKPAAAAPPSRGTTKAPSQPNPPHPLPRPIPAQPSVDAGRESAAGAGSAPGSGAGQGGQGAGTGAGGSGTGGGVASLPVHIAGALTDADYARSGLPRGATGTVTISFRVRADGGVDRCSVVRSSGYAAIDAATCRLFQQRFRFRPALDVSGRAIDYNLRTDFTWRPR